MYVVVGVIEEFSGSHGGENEVRVYWDVVPCSHVAVDRRFRGAYCLHHQGDELTYEHTKSILNHRPMTQRLMEIT
jgi:hypothetical protein